jgi:hypothetical protein
MDDRALARRDAAGPDGRCGTGAIRLITQRLVDLHRVDLHRARHAGQNTAAAPEVQGLCPIRA